MEPETPNSNQASAAVETTPPNGIKGVAAPESWWTPEHVAMFVVPLLLLLGMAWLVLVVLGRRRRNKATAVVIKDPWHELGLEIHSLAQPQAYSSESSQAWRQFASDVSVAARRIIGAATVSACEDWTTDEFAQKLPEMPSIEGLAASDVLILLRETDLIRFADRPPLEGIATRWIAQLKEWYRIQDERRRSTVQMTASSTHFETPSSFSSPASSGVKKESDTAGGLRVFD